LANEHPKNPDPDELPEPDRTRNEPNSTGEAPKEPNRPSPPDPKHRWAPAMTVSRVGLDQRWIAIAREMTVQRERRDERLDRLFVRVAEKQARIAFAVG
jgi:hypothetical protein